MRDVLQDSLATKCVFIVVGASFLALVQGTLHCLGYGANQGVLSEALVSIHRLHLVLFYNPSCIFNLISYRGLISLIFTHFVFSFYPYKWLFRHQRLINCINKTYNCIVSSYKLYYTRTNYYLIKCIKFVCNKYRVVHGKLTNFKIYRVYL